jgi:excisionase family DNA binding protein
MNTIALLTPEEAAAALGCSVRTAEELARKGTIPAVKFGDGGWRFPVKALEDRLNEMAMESANARRVREAPALVQVAAPKRRSPPPIP